jgi:RecB family exonuclease
MGEVSYRPLIEEMVWSYSRIESFEDCPYRWFLKYISKCSEEPKFYASFGSFMHKLIEMYYRGQLTKEDMLTKYLTDFSKEVQGVRPSESITKNYIRCGAEYLRSFQPLNFEMVDVEKRVRFDIDGIPFIGYIDYLGLKDGKYYIVDNKSRNLQPRSKRAKPTVKDKELDSMLKQLYIYSAAIKQEYGVFPEALCFNCFRTGTFIEEPFNEEAYHSAIDWAKNMVEDIKNTDEFYPNREFFSCYYICGVSGDCCYDQQAREERRFKV